MISFAKCKVVARDYDDDDDNQVMMMLWWWWWWWACNPVCRWNIIFAVQFNSYYGNKKWAFLMWGLNQCWKALPLNKAAAAAFGGKILINLMRGLVSVLCRKVTISGSWWWSTISYYYDVTYVIQIMLPHLLGQRICCWERSCKSSHQDQRCVLCLHYH